MDLVKGNLKEIYKKYLLASFGGAILPSIYGLVDMMAVGKYHGPDGSAAMAIIAPIWNVVFSFGLLTGIGGSILFRKHLIITVFNFLKWCITQCLATKIAKKHFIFR